MKHESDSKIGAAVRRNVLHRLVDLGWDQADLYDRAGLTKQHYSGLFKRDSGPTLAQLRQWADLLKCTVADLVAGVDDDAPLDDGAVKGAANETT